MKHGPTVPLRAFARTALFFAGAALAHPVDQCLQAAYLKLGPDTLGLELDMTPGERIVPQMMQLIDQNTDGLIGQPEVQRYADRVLQDLRLNIDGQSQILMLEPVLPPPADAFLAGGGTIKLLARANLKGTPGTHTLEFRNSYALVKSGYLVNVFV